MVPRVQPALAVLLAVTAAAAMLPVMPVPAQAKAPTQRACLAELMRGQGSEIACEYPVWMTDAERAEMRGWTADLMHDATCVVSVRISRELVVGALRRADSVFLAPPQPVTCTVTTAKAPLTISGSFAPRVVFRGGRAVEASPGLADVRGVPAALAWPIVGFVNSSSLIGNGLIDAVNSFLSRQRADASPLRFE